MKLSIYSLVVFYVAQALGLSIESKPVQEVEDQGDSVSPFISSFWDDFPADADYLIHSLSTMFGDMVQRHNQLFSGFRSNKGDTLASLPTHPFLRGLSAVSPSLTPVQFSIVDDDEKFQLSLRLPTGMTHEDVHVQVQDGGTRLLITGKTQSSSDNGANDNGKTPSFHTFASTSFTQTYSLDPSVEVDRLLATVKDGMFILSAPKDKRKLNDASHVIPVQGLNAMARSFVTPDRPSNTRINRRPHYLHKPWPVFDHDSAGPTEIQAAQDGTAAMSIRDAKLSNAETITDEWEDMHGSSL
jgi:HSP20 family molecular chaperone IbpA